MTSGYLAAHPGTRRRGAAAGSAAAVAVRHVCDQIESFPIRVHGIVIEIRLSGILNITGDTPIVTAEIGSVHLTMQVCILYGFRRGWLLIDSAERVAGRRNTEFHVQTAGTSVIGSGYGGGNRW